MNGLVMKVGWGEEDLMKMLKRVEKDEVKGRFLLEGKWVKKRRDVVKKMVGDGDEIGNH